MKLRQATSGTALTLGAVLLSFSLPQLAFAADGDETTTQRSAAEPSTTATDAPCFPLIDPDCVEEPDPEPTDPEPTIPEPTIPTPDPEPTDPEPTIPTPDPEPSNPEPSTPTPTIPNPGNGGGNNGGGNGGGNNSGAPRDAGAVAPGAANSSPQGAIAFDPVLGGLVSAGSGAADTPADKKLPDTGAEGGLNLLAGFGAVFLLIGVVLLRRPYAARHRLA